MDDASTTFIRKESEREDIVIGIVAPIGADLERVTECLTKEVADYGFITEKIRLSELLNYNPGFNSASSKGHETSQSERLMDLGDEVRTTSGNGGAMAAIAIARLNCIRHQMNTGYEKANPSTVNQNHTRNKCGQESFMPARGTGRVWILRTLKHPEEVKLLRYVYGSRFILLGINDSEENRSRVLKSLIQRRNPEISSIASHVTKLLERDQRSVDDLGQNVRDTNSLADFYIEIGQRLIADVKRTVSLLFGKPFETPTRDEQSMYYAYAASLRSSDSGRQVGAVITHGNGDVLAIGVNETPKAGGGQYWIGDSPDARDFQLGRDNNRWTNRLVLREVMHAVHTQLKEQKSIDNDLDFLLEEDFPDEKLIKNTRVASLIEFGRITHAEMSAITDCARNGISTAGTTMYVTAFPCHMCMRLIIASGVTRLVYIDPYPKSLASEMYADSIGPRPDGSFGLDIRPFRGTSWRVFPRIFELDNATRKRDKNGTLIWIPKSELKFRATPHHDKNQTIYRESIVIQKLRELELRKPEIKRLIDAETFEDWSHVAAASTDFIAQMDAIFDTHG